MSKNFIFSGKHRNKNKKDTTNRIGRSMAALLWSSVRLKLFDLIFFFGVIMAADVKLTGNDPVSDQLLSHVSHHVVSRLRKQFATGPLGLSNNQYDNIEEDAQYAERRNYEVINSKLMRTLF